jgi:hypothetical protein
MRRLRHCWWLRLMITAVCVYCGDPATCLDHIVPYFYSGKSVKRQGGSDAGRTVPACQQCNGGLHSKLFKTWEERCHYIWEWRTARGLPIFNQDIVIPPPPVPRRRFRTCIVCKTRFVLTAYNAHSKVYCSAKCRGKQWLLDHPVHEPGVFRRQVLPPLDVKSEDQLWWSGRAFNRVYLSR